MINVTDTYALLLGSAEKTAENDDPYRPPVSMIPRVGEELLKAVAAMTRHLLTRLEQVTTTAIEPAGEPPEEPTSTESPSVDSTIDSASTTSERSTQFTDDPVPDEASEPPSGGSKNNEEEHE